MTDAEIKDRIEMYSRESEYGGSLIIRHRVSYNFRITIKRASDDTGRKTEKEITHEKDRN